jgi:hypothetical protein
MHPSFLVPSKTRDPIDGEALVRQHRALGVFQGIWNEMKTLNGRVNATNERLDLLTARVDDLAVRMESGFARVDGRVDDLTARMEAGFTRVGGRIDPLTAGMEAGFDRVDRRFDQLLLGEHGTEHRDFRERIARIEQHVGLPPSGR